MTKLELDAATLTTAGVVRVHEVNAVISAAGLIRVIGANGSGKSSLLGLMSGHLQPTSGSVLVDQQNVADLSALARAHHLAWLGQSTPGAEQFSVRDVVSWGHIGRAPGQPTWQDEMTELIGQVGLDSLIDAPLASLSGGERQRVHIARVWLQAAPITLLDEPDANLDREARRILERLITSKVAGGGCVVMVTHDRDWAQASADELWVMDAGILTRQ